MARVKHHAGRLFRFQRIEIDVTRLILSGISLALPVAAGALTGNLADGLTATLGALPISAAGQHGELAAGWITAVAFTAALAAGIGTIEARSAAKATVFTVIAAHPGSGPDAPARIVLFIALGILTRTALTPSTYDLNRLLSPLWRRGLEAAENPTWPFHRSAGKWWVNLHTLDGWQYPRRLGAAMTAAEAISHIRAGAHTYWIPLTVSPVVLRDEAASPARAVERGLGTTIGVLFGGLLLGVLPT